MFFIFYTIFTKNRNFVLYFFQYIQIYRNKNSNKLNIYSLFSLCILFLCIHHAMYGLLFSTKKNTAKVFSPPYFPFLPCKQITALPQKGKGYALPLRRHDTMPLHIRCRCCL